MEALPFAPVTCVRGIFTRPGWLFDCPIIVVVVILAVLPLPLIMFMRFPIEKLDDVFCGEALAL